MKVLFLALALMIGGVASAETITLGPDSGLGYLHQYHDVPNVSDLLDEEGVPLSYYITIDPPQQASYAGGVFYIDSLQYTCLGMDAWQDDITNDCTAGDGTTARIHIVQTHVRKQINNGRAHYWVTKWTLLSGTIVR